MIKLMFIASFIAAPITLREFASSVCEWMTPYTGDLRSIPTMFFGQHSLIQCVHTWSACEHLRSSVSVFFIVELSGRAFVVTTNWREIIVSQHPSTTEPVELPLRLIVYMARWCSVAGYRSFVQSSRQSTVEDVYPQDHNKVYQRRTNRDPVQLRSSNNRRRSYSD
ncbi:c18.2 [Ichnoviriform fugitivi]|uniref:C18.2 n=1 Tax=Ichnoviriform fugitivi TaxID=265522 RepID=A2Q0I4_9VIRU|nr:c18.2 [Ichnoviriform fugitivi]BAF45699.1 c18.2 [Ichnoviriform fugitivi]